VSAIAQILAWREALARSHARKALVEDDTFSVRIEAFFASDHREISPQCADLGR
jgi:hypothetical protein